MSSRLPLKADLAQCSRHFAFVPEAGLAMTLGCSRSKDAAGCALPDRTHECGGRTGQPRTLSFMATDDYRTRSAPGTGMASVPVDGTEAVTHSSRGAVRHQPPSRGPGFPFTVARRLTALENSTPCGQSRTSSRRAHGVEEACDVRLQPLGLLRQPTG